MSPEILATGGKKKQRQLVSDACSFYLEHLMPGKCGQLRVEIELVSGLWNDDLCKADCIWEDDYTEYLVRLDSDMNLQGLLRCLAHECVHIKQYATGEMKDTSNVRYVKWHGKQMSQSDKDYWNSPWELEAYGREIGLLDEFIHVRGYDKKKWYSDRDYS